ncbi:MAG: DNA polymerase/3'-5' exonuclease PolX [Candidatus Liptonbacteria bacterium]|nr:DNA polymerase/3'-5' exonuclease PolX [Candidatus Liptonbacteria bacterium]
MKEVHNTDIAKILHEIALYLEMQSVPFKPRAYEKVAEVIEGLAEPVADIYSRGGLAALKDIPGVGASIAEKIEEFLTKGKVAEHEALKKKTPVDLESFAGIEGVGPKSILKLYRELGIKNAGELEKAAKAGKVREVEGFGAKKEEGILAGIEFMRRSAGRLLISEAMPHVRALEARLREVPGVEKVIVAGSARRRKETIGDIDILAIAKEPARLMEYFVGMKGVERVHAHGPTKSSVRLSLGLDADLRVVPAESYGAALNYFTGSKDHNVALRQIAIKKGLKLNEYGLFETRGTTRTGRGQTQKEKMVAGKTEEEVYKVLGLDYIEPELRENTGEIEATLRHSLPELITYDALQGDLQMHSNWTDGKFSIEEMAKGAAARGLKYIAITDHTKRLAMTHGLDEKRIQMQWKEIDAVNKKLKGTVAVLKGTECDILKDGTLDFPDEILAKLDIAGVSVHSYFNLPREAQTERIVRAMRNPHADILFHPTGRIVGKRDPYDVDMEELIRAANKTGTCLEVDAFDRLDLKDEYVRKCVEAGVKFAIDSDAHAPAHFGYLEYGIAQARRGWAAKEDVINAWPLDEMLKFLKRN